MMDYLGWRNVTASSLMVESINQQQMTIINKNHHVLNVHITIINYCEAPSGEPLKTRTPIQPLWQLVCVRWKPVVMTVQSTVTADSTVPSHPSAIWFPVSYKPQAVPSPPGGVPRFHRRHAYSLHCRVSPCDGTYLIKKTHKKTKTKNIQHRYGLNLNPILLIH